MKYRTDFVTNSSSSAFIFEKGLNYKKLFQKEELLGLEKRIKKISDLDSWDQASLFWWFGTEEYIYHKKENFKEYELLFAVLAYGAETYRFDDLDILTENGEITYEELLERISNTKVPDPNLDDYNGDYIREYIPELEAVLEEVVTKRNAELLSYAEQLQEQKVCYGALLMQYFDCEDIIYSNVDLEWGSVIELGHLWEEKKVRCLTIHH